MEKNKFAVVYIWRNAIYILLFAADWDLTPSAQNTQQMSSLHHKPLSSRNYNNLAK